MNLIALAFKNINGNSFRSWVVVLCALLVASMALTVALILRGAQNSLQLAADRLGADIIVVPDGAASKVESALLMGTPASVWMPFDNLEKVAAVPGVAVASPQLYLSTLHGASCCSVSDMFLVAYDPQTDFTISPWLRAKTGGGLKIGEGVGGQYVFVPEGEQNIKLYGYFVTLRENLEATGTGIDQSMFLTFETAREMARISLTQAEQPLVIPEGSISSVMVKLEPGVNSRDTAIKIMQNVSGVTAIESPNLFQSYRRQINGLLTTIITVTGITLVLSVLLIGLVFSMAANERRRELGVLRALGATRAFILQSLVAEAGILALTGSTIGVSLSALVVYLFRDFIMQSLNIPFLLPSPFLLLAQVLIGIFIALAAVSLAALFPAYRVSRQDPAIAMRE